MLRFPEKLFNFISSIDKNDVNSPIVVKENNQFQFKEGITNFDKLLKFGIRTNSIASLSRNLNYYGFGKDAKGWYIHESGKEFKHENLKYFKRRKIGSLKLSKTLGKRKYCKDYSEDTTIKNNDISFPKIDVDDNIFEKISESKTLSDLEIDKNFEDPEWIEKQLVFFN